MRDRYRFFRCHHGRFISLILLPDQALFWGFIYGAVFAASVS